MSPNDDAMTALIPKSLNAHTACSLEEPHPKLSPLLKSFTFGIPTSSAAFIKTSKISNFIL